MIPIRSIPVPSAPLDRILGVVLRLGVFGAVGSLVRFWGIRPEYADRLLVLLGSVWTAYQAIPYALSLPVRPRPLLALPFLVAGGLIVPFGWYLQVQSTGGRAAVLWFQCGGMLLLIGASILSRYGYPRLRAFGFPLVFAAFALPIPSIIMSPLQMLLQEGMTTLAEKTLPLLGIPVLQRDGFVIRLAGGDLGIAEACSGVRSLTALTAIAAYIAYLRGFGPIRGIALVLISVPIVAAVNGIRVVGSGVIQEWFGEKYIRGDWHEALGLAMVFLGLGIIAQVAKLFGPASVSIPPEEMPSPVSSSLGGSLSLGIAAFVAIVSGFSINKIIQGAKLLGDASVTEPPVETAARPGLGGSLALAAAVFAASLSGVAIIKGMATNERLVARAEFDAIPLVLGEGRELWKGTPLEVPPYVTEMLGNDRAIFREYENNTGRRVYVWALFWSTTEMVKGYHHPDVCWGCKGYTTTDKRIETISPSAGGSIPATVREFARDHYAGKLKEYQYVLYWTQEGPQVWDDRDELRAQAGGFFFNPKLWFGDYTREEAVGSTGRIVVLIATPTTDPAAQADTLKFARIFSDQLYLACPWAGPPHPPSR